MHIFKNAWFRRFAHPEEIADRLLKELLVLSDAQIAQLIEKNELTEVINDN